MHTNSNRYALDDIAPFYDSTTLSSTLFETSLDKGNLNNALLLSTFVRDFCMATKSSAWQWGASFSFLTHKKSMRHERLAAGFVYR